MAAELPYARNPRDLDPNVDVENFANLDPRAKDRVTLDLLGWLFRRPASNLTPVNRRQLRRASNRRTWQPVYKNNPMAPHGGFGLVHLWVCTDEREQIIDRVIIKECIPGQATYNDARFWRNGVGSEPRECWMANLVHDNLMNNNPGDERHATECLGWGDVRGGGSRLWAYKLYFEYCEHGDLHSLIGAQSRGHHRLRRHRSRIDRRRRVLMTRGDPEPFPEGFLWHLFESLAKAVVAMENTQVLHGDMQAGNVLLGAPDPTRFKIWPIAKLADWGASRILDVNTSARVGALDEAIALNFVSPEQACDETFTNWEVPNLTFTAKTNVYQLGMLMCSAMRLEWSLPEADWRGRDPAAWREQDPAKHINFSVVTQRDVRLLKHDRASYSPELISLVRRCLSYDQVNRPTPAQLLHDIQRDMVGKLDNMDTRTKVPWNHPQRLVKRMRNEWAIGSDFDPDFPVPFYPEPGSDSDSDYESSSSDGDGGPARPRAQYNLRP